MKSFCIYILIIAVAVPLLYADMAVHSEVLGPGQAPVPGVSDSLILVDVRVQDNHGNPVRRLRAGDFSLYQDGEEQAITRFQVIDRAGKGADPRIIVFIIDDIDLPENKYLQVQKAVHYFADNVMQPDDRVGIAYTAGGGYLSQALTSDPSKIKASMGPWPGLIKSKRKQPTMYVQSDVDLSPAMASALGVKGRLLREMVDPTPYNAVENIMDQLRPLHQRVTVILFSDNHFERSLLSEKPGTAPEIAHLTLYQAGLPGWQRAWQDIAENTGGYAIKAKTDQFSEIKRILSGLDCIYVLGYKPGDRTLYVDSWAKKFIADKNGSQYYSLFHKLKVKIKSSAAKARTKSGFTLCSSAPGA